MIRFLLAAALGAVCCYGAAEVPGASSYSRVNRRNTALYAPGIGLSASLGHLGLKRPLEGLQSALQR